MHHAAMSNHRELMVSLARMGCDPTARAEGIQGATAAFVLCSQHAKTSQQLVSPQPPRGLLRLEADAPMIPSASAPAAWLLCMCRRHHACVSELFALLSTAPVQRQQPCVTVASRLQLRCKLTAGLLSGRRGSRCSSRKRTSWASKRAPQGGVEQTATAMRKRAWLRTTALLTAQRPRTLTWRSCWRSCRRRPMLGAALWGACGSVNQRAVCRCHAPETRNREKQRLLRNTARMCDALSSSDRVVHCLLRHVIPRDPAAAGGMRQRSARSPKR